MSRKNQHPHRRGERTPTTDDLLAFPVTPQNSWSQEELEEAVRIRGWKKYERRMQIRSGSPYLDPMTHDRDPEKIPDDPTEPELPSYGSPQKKTNTAAEGEHPSIYHIAEGSHPYSSCECAFQQHYDQYGIFPQQMRVHQYTLELLGKYGYLCGSMKSKIYIHGKPIEIVVIATVSRNIIISIH